MSKEPSLFDRPQQKKPDAYIDTSTGETIISPEKKLFRGSVSLARTWNTCGAKGYAYLTKQPVKKTVHTAGGSAIHSAIEHYLRNEADLYKTFDAAFKENAERDQIDTSDAKVKEWLQEAPRMLSSAHALLNDTSKGRTLYQAIDRDLIEFPVAVESDNGFIYVGFLDVVHVLPNGTVVFLDWKSGKTAPVTVNASTGFPRIVSSKLDSDQQFSLYILGLAQSTHPKIADHKIGTGKYVHLRGVSFDVDTSAYKSGARQGQPRNTLIPVEDANPAKVQYMFDVKRELPQVFEHVEDLDRTMATIASGHFPRNYDACTSFGGCGYWDKEKNRCTVELPSPSRNPGMSGELANLKPITLKDYKSDESEEDL